MQVYLETSSYVSAAFRSPKLDGAMYSYEKDIFTVRWDYQENNCDVLATFKLDKEELQKASK